MSPVITYVKKKNLRSLHCAFETVANEGRFFVRTYAPTRRALRQIVWDALERDLPYYAAVENDVVAGWAAVLFPKLPALAHSGTVVMGVLPSYRGQGLGTSLLTQAVSHAFQNAAHRRIQLEVFRDNTAAVRLYTRFGFQMEGVAKQAVFSDGKYKDVLHMALLRDGYDKSDAIMEHTVTQ